MPIWPRGATGNTPLSRPGSGAWVIAARRFIWLTMGQPQTYDKCGHKKWVTAYEHRRPGSTRVRARELRSLYEEAEPVPNVMSAKAANEFLLELRQLAREAIETGGGRVVGWGISPECRKMSELFEFTLPNLGFGVADLETILEFDDERGRAKMVIRDRIEFDLAGLSGNRLGFDGARFARAKG